MSSNNNTTLFVAQAKKPPCTPSCPRHNARCFIDMISFNLPKSSLLFTHKELRLSKIYQLAFEVQSVQLKVPTFCSLLLTTQLSQIPLSLYYVNQRPICFYVALEFHFNYDPYYHVCCRLAVFSPLFLSVPHF